MSQRSAMDIGVNSLFSPQDILNVIPKIREPLTLVRNAQGSIGIAITAGPATIPKEGNTPVATLPPLYPEWLGDRAFLEAHRLRFPYVAGEMARGIATAKMVTEMAGAGMLGFFGAAGLSLDEIEKNLAHIDEALRPRGLSWGTNLIHSPNEPHLERATVDLYLRRNVERVSASAFMAVTPNLVHFAFRGISLDAQGNVLRPRFIFAKISRPELAASFMSPPPAPMLESLVADGSLSPEEAALASKLPISEDITVEADSGGHTDNRPLVALLPIILSLRDELTQKYGYVRPIRIGAAGGLATPTSVAAAFALGASYVLTGTINQAAIESGLSTAGKRLLAEAGVADVMMAPAADMFEMGVKVQVLKKGALFGLRASKLYDLYRDYASMEALPPKVREQIETDLFKQPLSEIWSATRNYFQKRDPSEVERAERDPKHKMALVFRWYLGNSSRWAMSGDTDRVLDYQIWCGPAQGAFNRWVAGSFLEPLAERTVTQIARNLLEGAAVVTRAHQLRTFGVAVPPSAFEFIPRRLQ